MAELRLNYGSVMAELRLSYGSVMAELLYFNSAYWVSVVATLDINLCKNLWIARENPNAAENLDGHLGR